MNTAIVCCSFAASVGAYCLGTSTGSDEIVSVEVRGNRGKVCHMSPDAGVLVLCCDRDGGCSEPFDPCVIPVS